jgi:hypothetical protein
MNKYADQLPVLDDQKDRLFLDSIPQQVEEIKTKLKKDEKAHANREKIKHLID